MVGGILAVSQQPEGISWRRNVISEAGNVLGVALHSKSVLVFRHSGEVVVVLRFCLREENCVNCVNVYVRCS